MQYTLLKHLPKAESVNYGSWLFRIGLLLLFLYFLFMQGWAGHLSLMKMQQFGLHVYTRYPLQFCLVLALVFLNWGLEITKWKELVSPRAKIGYWQATKGVLAGLGLAFVTPRGLGDYAGRVFMLSVKHSLRLMPAVWLGRVAQSVWTYLGGLLGLVYLLPLLPQAEMENMVFLFVAAAIALVLGVAASLIWRTQLVKYLKRLHRRVGVFLHVLLQYKTAQLLKVYAWAGLRYLVFSLQFFLLLSMALPDLPALSLWAVVGLIFLIKSLVPSFNFLNDLGVREFSALLVLEMLNEPTEVVVWASLLLWLINILLPSIAGCLVLLYHRIRFKQVL